MKNFLVYGNCQAGPLIRTLNKNLYFINIYKENPVNRIQTLGRNDIPSVKKAFTETDLLIYQNIKDTYRIPELSSNTLLKYSKTNATSLSFVSLYFNAYFPHLDTFNGRKSILNLVHDYIIMSLYLKGMNQQEILDLLHDEHLYNKKVAINKLNSSLSFLKKREEITNLHIVDFIKKEYRYTKLFNVFHHPRAIIFDELANQIFEILGLPKVFEATDANSKIGLDRIMAPIYKSTYKHLDLQFSEDFTLYSTIEGDMKQDEVVDRFLKFYKTLQKDEIQLSIERKKPFLTKMFNNLGI